MCGRFALYTVGQTVANLFGIGQMPRLQPRYNIAPTQTIAVVRHEPSRSGRVLEPMRWGLVPPWAKGLDDGPLLINARSETVTERPAYKGLIRHKRGIVIADGFYEWQDTAAGKQPYLVHATDEKPLGLAALWAEWRHGTGDVLESCTILTTKANEVVRPIHDRMPVVLPRDAYATWLDPKVQDASDVEPLLAPAPDGALTARPVSKRVNDVDNDDAALVEPQGQSMLS